MSDSDDRRLDLLCGVPRHSYITHTTIDHQTANGETRTLHLTDEAKDMLTVRHELRADLIERDHVIRQRMIGPEIIALDAAIAAALFFDVWGVWTVIPLVISLIAAVRWLTLRSTRNALTRMIDAL